MKTFFNLMQEVQKPGFCHHCGGCVSFCTAINYGALETDETGRPRYRDMEKCIECGICYDICPEIGELDEEIRRRAAWSMPLGRVIETTVARAKDEPIRRHATDGGAVTAILTHLMDIGRIDGAIVSKPVGAFHREPALATTREEIIEAAGFHFDTSHGMHLYSDTYSTYSPSIQELAPVMRRGLRRVAFVGTPCQIETIRKMEALGIVPSDSIHFHLGLFCTGNFTFHEEQRKKLEEMGDFRWDDVDKVNVKETLMIHLKDGEVRRIGLDDLDFMKRYACRYCADYTAEFADISFGGIGAEKGWTTVLIRTPLGRAVFADARGKDLEELTHKESPKFASEAMNTVRKWSAKKKKAARENRRRLGKSHSFSQ
jgi:coenzyme F420 hydrogenase subunit beta